MSDEREKAMKMAKRAVIQGYAARLPMLMVKHVVERFGDEGWKALEKAGQEFAAYRAPLLKVLVDNTENARDLGKIFDFEDGLSGVEGQWEEHGTMEATKTENKCIASEVYKEFPDHCGKFLWHIANETLKIINPKSEVLPFNKVKCLAYGDDCCEVKIRIAK